MRTNKVKSPRKPLKSSSKKSKSPKKSTIRQVLEFVLLLLWLFLSGILGYMYGQYSSDALPCSTSEDVNSASANIDSLSTINCDPISTDVLPGTQFPSDGYTFEQLSTLWTCSQPSYNFTDANQLIFPKETYLEKTKWKSILSVEPKYFFEKYLTQYPRDIRATQPVLVFSHRPLNKTEDIPEVCKVLDIAIVPDRPGVCVAVTETFHDVASYHMLHAEKQVNGHFSLTTNHIKERILPSEHEYNEARRLLLDYFNYVAEVETLIKKCPKYDNGRVTLGVFISDKDEALLFKNAYSYAKKQNISPNKYCIFTTSSTVSKDIYAIDTHFIVLEFPFLDPILRRNPPSSNENLYTYFLQAWLAFSTSQNNIRILWQSPGTLWFSKPDELIKSAPLSETIWSYKGRKDIRAAPFYVSFDFFTITSNERPVHLIHEMMLHFDLVLAWKTFDSVLSYRLAENNARYGTTSYLWPPHEVLHIDLLAHQSDKIKHVLTVPKSPKVIIFPRQGKTAIETIELIKASNLWVI